MHVFCLEISIFGYTFAAEKTHITYSLITKTKRMKNLFTLVAAALMTLSANAALENVASYTVAEGNPVDGSEIVGSNCTIQLHTGDLKANAVDATKLGAQLNTEQKYVQIDFAKDFIQAGDIVYFSYFVGSNPSEDATEGISVSNVKVGNEGYQELAKLFVQKKDQKNIVTSGFVANGGEKKFILYKLASTTMFYAVKVVRGYSNTIDFTNPAINTKTAAEACFTNAVNFTIEDTSDGSDGSAVAEWKNTAGQTAAFEFIAAPISVSYKNNSAKTFAKSRTTGFQFNSKDVSMKITCNAGAKITITPGKYSKEGVGGKYNLTGATVDGATGEEATVLTIPENSTDAVTITATGAGVTLTTVNAGILQKISINNDGTTAIKSLKAVKGKNNAMYNLAGQKVAAGFKGLVIKEGKKVIK